MGYDDEIADLRVEINRLNEEIMGKIAERVKVALKIGEVKSRFDRPIRDPAREAKVIEQVRGVSRSYGLDDIAVERVFGEIIRLCTEAEERARP